MNIGSEVQFFGELSMIDKGRFLSLFMHEMAEEARSTYGPGNDLDVSDAQHLRFINELQHRMGRLVYQILSEDPARPADEVVIRMLLASRIDKVAEKLVHNAYRRVLQTFERHDTTILVNI